ncbi:MAG: Calx-beta domain-containing protein, partial [Blastocatellia bacterium]
FIVTNTNDSGEGSLRQAILDANFSPGASAINFNISGAPPFTINLQTDLPRIFVAVSIDASTQPGFAGKPIIEVTGSYAESRGVNLIGGNSVIRGLALNRFRGGAIGLGGRGNNIVEGNYIGTDVAGATRQSNGVGVGVEESTNNVIGGTAAAAMNLISGGDFAGILFNGSGANSNIVQGNLIGVNLAQTESLSNFFAGVAVFSNNNHVIGGTAPGARNVISGNGHGIFLSGSGHLAQGNFIGLDAAGAGTARIANLAGIEVSDARASIIGGTTIAARNVISGNASAGLKIGSPEDSALLVQGNYIGVAADGLTPMPNSLFGSTLGDSFVGGISASGGVIIGGAVSDAGNLIANNGKGGVIVFGGKVTVRGNSIFANIGLGIDIFPYGVMANDDCDTDTGTNNLQN